MIEFVNSYGKLPLRFFERRLPIPVAHPELVKLNHTLAIELGLELTDMDVTELAAVFAGNKILPGSEPLAMAYAGHQFGNFVSQLGDGRAILLGEVIDREGRRRDVHLKGSGPTAFSRGGDGRAALGPVIREYLISEAFAAMKIPTTRSLAMVKTGETVLRERPLPGAILTRVALGHIRVGTFEYFAARGDLDGVKALADYAIDRLFPEIKTSHQPYLTLYEEVIERQARLIAQWMCVGFIHGVMNTDNTNISGETIDFGPCAFMDVYKSMQVFSSIDRHGRYAFNQQPKIAEWNLTVLGHCLLPLFAKEPEHAGELGQQALDQFRDRYQRLWLVGMAAKLGLVVEFNQTKTSKVETLMTDYLALMEEVRADFTLSFAHLTQYFGDISRGENGPGESSPGESSPESLIQLKSLFQSSSKLDEWLQRWDLEIQQQGCSRQAVSERMTAANPVVIPRNHLVEQVISAAVEKDDWAPMNEFLEAITHPYDPKYRETRYILPPRDDERVCATFCGT
jgi:uncharacterized protein YdiU (UPF0061 family)